MNMKFDCEWWIEELFDESVMKWVGLVLNVLFGGDVVIIDVQGRILWGILVIDVWCEFLVFEFELVGYLFGVLVGQVVIVGVCLLFELLLCMEVCYKMVFDLYFEVVVVDFEILCFEYVCLQEFEVCYKVLLGEFEVCVKVQVF